MARSSWTTRWEAHFIAALARMGPNPELKDVRAEFRRLWTDARMGPRTNWSYTAYCKARRRVLYSQFPHLRPAPRADDTPGPTLWAQ